MNTEALNPSKFTNEISDMFDRYSIDAHRALIEHGHNPVFRRTIENLIAQNQLIYNKFLMDPRLPWIIIQEDIDNVYRKDNTINGYQINLLTQEDGQNIANLKYLLKKPTI